MTRFTGKVALVTGAASGIGLATTRRLLDDGARVVAGDIDEAGLAAISPRTSADHLVTARCDVTQEIDVENLSKLAVSHFGGLDIAVANAGAGGYALVTEHPLQEWQRVIDLCLTGVFLTIKHSGSVMRDGGSIVTVASLNAIQPSRGMAAYCTAKAGVAMLTRVAAMELGPRGIRVNTVAPGLVQTNATGTFFAIPPIVEEFNDNAPLGRFASPDEIASVIAFLASDDSSYMSASFVSVDGGGNTGRYPNLPAAFERIGLQSPGT